MQRNRVYDTGGGANYAVGIDTDADVIDNTVAGVLSGAYASGILVGGAHTVRNNRVRGVQGDNGGVGIQLYAPGSAVDGNQVAIPAGYRGYGILGESSGHGTVCSNNVVSVFASTPMQYCVDAGGNTSL